MSRHRVSNRTHSKYSTRLVRSDLQKSLIGPSFVEAVRTENRKDMEIQIRFSQSQVVQQFTALLP